VADDRVRVASLQDIAPGQCLVVEVDADLTVALVNVDGRVYAVDNLCPHRGGPLGEGPLKGAVLQCPWHGWQIDVTTGGMVQNPNVKTPSFPVVVENGEVSIVRSRATS
jgi:nitrite reductase/ring-hydroxylating ferredoxin subunit